MTIPEEQAERFRVVAERLAAAERELILARKKYNRALRNWEATAQTRLDEGREAL